MTVGAVGVRMALSFPPIGLGISNNDDPGERAATVAAAALEFDERNVERIEGIDPEDAPW